MSVLPLQSLSLPSHTSVAGVVGVHAYSQSFGLLSLFHHPLWHEPKTHAPAAQVQFTWELGCRTSQRWPHAPQLSGSVAIGEPGWLGPRTLSTTPSQLSSSPLQVSACAPRSGLRQVPAPLASPLPQHRVVRVASVDAGAQM
jgi:hypothetical protein